MRGASVLSDSGSTWVNGEAIVRRGGQRGRALVCDANREVRYALLGETIRRPMAIAGTTMEITLVSSTRLELERLKE